MGEVVALPDFRLPSVSDRLLVAGRTGSGKTRMGAWVLSEAPFDQQPYVVVDYKGEDLFAMTDSIREIGYRDVLKHPGLYILRPRSDEAEAVEAWLWKIHARERTGLFIDEGYGIAPRSGALQAILTQGRSKRIPVIYLAQRPAHISAFVASEASHFSVFALSKKDDRDRIRDYLTQEQNDAVDLEAALPDFHSHWFDVKRNRHFVMQPVPGDDDILNRIEDRLQPKRRFL